MSSFSGFGGLGLSFIVVCPGQPMMAEIWSAYNILALGQAMSLLVTETAIVKQRLKKWW